MEEQTVNSRLPGTIQQAGSLVLLVSAMVLVVLGVPNRIWDDLDSTLLLGIGSIAAWRYGWWALHFVRSSIYSRLVFPRLRRRADLLWESGWRPGRMHFLVTTFRERPDITEAVLESIFRDCRSSGIPARVFLGTGDPADEKVIEDYCGRAGTPDVEVIVVRQNQSGKRMAMGLALRSMSRHGVEPGDIAIFMDGDTVIGRGAIAKCAPLFGLNAALGALTTDESATVNGPRWMQAWHDMRFAQRRLAMQSHALSRKVLTLTGRFSVFRAELVVRPEFIRNIEFDCLDHWLWGRFRFLSGDDKSTWYSLLESGHEMLYVPDAWVWTIENIGPRPLKRAQQNLLRWSGNMLRNGSRALALGPRRCGLFIWWCVLDQRLSIWTTLSGPVFALILSLAVGLHILYAYAVWVLLTRALLAIVLYCYAGRIYLSFPFLLYGSQVFSGMIKVYLLFRVAKQRWLNRGDQRQKAPGGRLVFWQRAMAAFLTVFYITLFIFASCLKTGFLDRDSLSGAIRLLHIG